MGRKMFMKDQEEEFSVKERELEIIRKTKHTDPARRMIFTGSQRSPREEKMKFEVLMERTKIKKQARRRSRN
jgi:hypothetical protein